MPPILATGFRRRRTFRDYFFDALQVVHFLIAMGFLWAGVVEFIRNPPYFDAYGDAATLNDLPIGLFEVKRFWESLDFSWMNLSLIWICKAQSIHLQTGHLEIVLEAYFELITIILLTLIRPEHDWCKLNILFNNFMSVKNLNFRLYFIIFLIM